METKNIISILLMNESPEYVLFKTAVVFAEQGLLVWFISSKPFENIPMKITQLDKEILQQITFLYLKDLEDLITQLNGIHLWHKSPSIIILSQFKTYIEVPGKDNNFLAAFILASLLDSASVCSRKNNKKSLILTCIEDIPNLPFLFLTWRRKKSKNDLEFMNPLTGCCRGHAVVIMGMLCTAPYV